MPKFSFLFTTWPFTGSHAAQFRLQLTILLSSLAVFLINFSPRAAHVSNAAQAFAGESLDSPLMAVAA
jgi:hypothetical protein